MIRAAAPGKVVLWGEYAVLAGAPALVQAVDRYALCTLNPGGAGWQCSARGFAAAPASVTAAALTAAQAPPPDAVWTLLWRVARSLGTVTLPADVTAVFDTEGLHERGIKLGLGSSAALSVAVYGALCRLLGRPAELGGALAAHRQLQTGATPEAGAGSIRGGSGIDVAAAWHGGLLRFRRGGPGAAPAEAGPWQLPASWHLVHVWSGVAARTGDHLANLERYLDSGPANELTVLAEHSRALFCADDPLARLQDYVAALRDLDRAAGLGVYSAPHQALAQLANAVRVVYKPCGAGGGDIGVGFTDDPDAAARFASRAAGLGFLPLPLETARHGIRVTP